LSEGALPRVVIVDDDANQRFLLKLGLKEEFDLQLAADGESALGLVAERPPFVLVTDLRMPGMTGLELARRVAAEHPAIIRVLMTAWPERDEIAQAVADGVVAHVLAKPLRIDVLRAYLRGLSAGAPPPLAGSGERG
jgi:CheY-like chemotaxis protein